MGGEWFEEEGTGATAQEAFDKLVKEAQYDYGHSGYTGTIAEKPGFELVEAPEGFVFGESDLVNALPAHLGKWDAAAAFKVPGKDDTWVFFGVASS